MTSAETSDFPASYPYGGTYADVLNWHLNTWGTRATNGRRSAETWKPQDFTSLVSPNDSDDNARIKLKGWLGAGFRPTWVTAQLIEKVLFGDHQDLLPWKIDLREAWQRSSGKGNNRLTTPSERVASLGGQPAAGLADSLHPTDPNEPILAELGLRRDLLEVLALRFGYESPDEPDAVLLSFLKQAAREYRELKARIAALADGEQQLANVLGSAQSALDQGKFEDAEELLRSAEESYEQNRTLVAIRTQSQIRISRGDAAFLAGEADIGTDHYLKAAEFFHHFDAREEADARMELGHRLLAKTPGHFRSPNDALLLFEPAEPLFPAGSNERAIAQMNSGLCLIFKSRIYDGELDVFLDRANRAIEKFDDAFSVLKSKEYAEHIAHMNWRYAWCLHARALWHCEHGGIKEVVANLLPALERCESALPYFELSKHPSDWFDINEFRAEMCLLLAEASPGDEQPKFADACLQILRSVFEHRAESGANWVRMTRLYIHAAAIKLVLGDHQTKEVIFSEIEDRLNRELALLGEPDGTIDDWTRSDFSKALDGLRTASVTDYD